MNIKKTLLKMLCTLPLSAPCFGMQARLSKTISSAAQNASKRITEKYQTFKAAPLKNQVTTVAHIGAKTAAVAGVIGACYVAEKIHTAYLIKKADFEKGEKYRRETTTLTSENRMENSQYALESLNIPLAEQTKIITWVEQLAKERGIYNESFSVNLTNIMRCHQAGTNDVSVPLPKNNAINTPGHLIPEVNDADLKTHEAILGHELTHVINQDVGYRNALQNTRYILPEWIDPFITFACAIQSQFYEQCADEGVPNKPELLETFANFLQNVANNEKAFFAHHLVENGRFNEQQAHFIMSLPGLVALKVLQASEFSHPPTSWRIARFHMRLQGLEHGKLSGLKDADILLPMLN